MAEIVSYTTSEMPDRIKNLKRDKRGYPVPWFVEWIDDEPQFPVMDFNKWVRAVNEKLCWVCGEKLGAHLAFVVGPMCGINRTSAEPPSHLECATFSVKSCPFLKNPNMKRIENEYTKDVEAPGGIMIKRNPGVSLIWITKQYRVFNDGNGGRLIYMGEPHGIGFWKEGRLATRFEVLESIKSGLPILEKVAQAEGEEVPFTKATYEFLKMVEEIFGDANSCTPEPS